ncbi:MAG TPA: ArsB/NhaD family transporter [Geobacteraceae bacterium]|nr:ArsB/NhaD family transporter [Geobacteraceae bacterium]
MPDLHTSVGAAIFLATLAVIMIRPYGVPEAVAALGGAALMLAGGFVRPAEAVTLLVNDWNVYGFFLGMMAISALADQAGIFEMLAYRAGQWGRGSGMRLYLAVFAVGAMITAFLSNDATALILTPVVYALATRLRLAVLPFVFACTFIADTASFLLPVSNPINILFMDACGGNLGEFLHHLLLPSIFCIGFNIAVFAWLFRRDLRMSYDPALLPVVDLPDRRYYNFTVVLLILVAVAYVAAAANDFPLSIVALSGGMLLFAGAARYRCLDMAKLGKEISWSLFAFITGMFIVVRAVENLGLTTSFGGWLTGLAGDSRLGAVLIIAACTALGANLINNVPMALVMISVLGAMHAHPVNRALVYAAAFGADLGPNLTTVGSLATMLWLLILRRRGLEVSTREYFKLGVTVVPVMILAGSLLIWMNL